MTPVAAVIVSHNSASVLESCIESVKRHMGVAQYIVVDNCSTDESVSIARRLGADVIVNQCNAGFGAACNVGARAAAHEVVLFVNPDIRVTSADVRGLNGLLTRRPLGLLGPRSLLAPDDTSGESSLRGAPPWPYQVAREAAGPVLPARLAVPLTSLIDGLAGRAWLSAALLLCARAEFLDVGGFDESFFLYYEDQELSRRYAAHGLPLVVTNAITCRHARGGSSRATDDVRALPRAASALSSVELVGITLGPRSASRAWHLYRALARLALALTWLAARSRPGGRYEGKLRELRATRLQMRALVRQGAPHYPVTKKIARRAIP
jgi:GT2 family glycosyltransferase